MATQIGQDASDVLGALVEAQKTAEAANVDQIDAELSGHEIRQATKLTPNRINRAVDLLDAEGYAELDKWMGTVPYDFGAVRATSHGFLAYEQARAETMRRDGESSDLDSATMRLRRPRPEVETIIERATGRARELLAAADGVRDSKAYEAWVHDLERWHALTRDGLAASYDRADPAEEFYDSATGGIFRQIGQDEDATFRYRQEATRAAINTLDSLRERLDYVEAPPPSAPELLATERAVGRGVFLVHGHDEERKQTVARFLDRVTEPGAIVLSEQPDQGRTIIEKFEQYASEAGYAVVLLTADDEGRKRATDELPSDISGVLYLALDAAGAWKTKLAREMLEAGVGIDANEVLRA